MSSKELNTLKMRKQLNIIIKERGIDPVLCCLVSTTKFGYLILIDSQNKHIAFENVEYIYGGYKYILKSILGKYNKTNK